MPATSNYSWTYWKDAATYRESDAVTVRQQAPGHKATAATSIDGDAPVGHSLRGTEALPGKWAGARVYFIAAHERAIMTGSTEGVSAKVNNTGTVFEGKLIADDYRVVTTPPRNSPAKDQLGYTGEGMPPSTELSRALVVHFDATADACISFSGTPTE